MQQPNHPQEGGGGTWWGAHRHGIVAPRSKDYSSIPTKKRTDPSGGYGTNVNVHTPKKLLIGETSSLGADPIGTAKIRPSSPPEAVFMCNRCKTLFTSFREVALCEHEGRSIIPGKKAQREVDRSARTSSRNQPQVDRRARTSGRKPTVKVIPDASVKQYECHVCHRVFNSHRAFGGHISGHSRKAKGERNRESNSSNLAPSIGYENRYYLRKTSRSRRKGLSQFPRILVDLNLPPATNDDKKGLEIDLNLPATEN